MTKNLSNTIFTFVFYYISDWEKNVPKLTSFLSETGRCCIVLQSKANANFKLRKLFFPILHGLDYNKDNIETIVDILKTNKIVCKIFKTISYLNIEQVLKDPISQTGKNLVTFIVNKNYDDIDLSIRQEIIIKIGKMAQKVREKRQLKFDDGYVVF